MSLAIYFDMNILYVNEDTKGGGSSIALLHYVNAMKERGHVVCVLTKDDDGYIIKELRQSGAKVFLCKFNLCYYPLFNNPFLWIKGVLGIFYRRYNFNKVISNIIISENIDIVHTNVGPLPYALSVCKRLHVPHIWHHREYFNRLTPKKYFPYKGDFYWKIKQSGNYNICITHGIMDYLGIKEGRFNRVIFDGVFSQSDINEKKIEIKEKYILFAGKVQKNKAPDKLIVAFAEFYKKHNDYKLLLAGRYEETNDYYKKCNKLIDLYNLRDCTEFLGYRKDLKRLMEKATAIVVPTLFEGFGFVMVEGMLSKSLLIGYNTTGTKEQFDLGLLQSGEEIGLRFSNKKELVDALEYAITHDMTDMINRAYKVVCNNYTIERCVNETEEFYKYVIDDYRDYRNN